MYLLEIEIRVFKNTYSIHFVLFCSSVFCLLKFANNYSVVELSFILCVKVEMIVQSDTKFFSGVPFVNFSCF